MVRNRSFTMPQSLVSMYQLEEYTRPMVGRSVQVSSLCFTKRDWKANVASEAKAHLLVFTPDAKESTYSLVSSTSLTNMSPYFPNDNWRAARYGW